MGNSNQNKKTLNNSQQGSGANNESPPFDQAEEIFSDLVEQLRDREFKTFLDRFNVEYVAAKPTTEPTNYDTEDIEQAKADERFERRCKYARNLSKAIMKRMSDSSDSRLFITAEKILDLLDEIESGDESKWRQLDTTTYALVQLCRGEDAKLAEKDQKAAPNRRMWIHVKRIPRWIYYLVAFLAALLTCIYLSWWLWTTFFV